MERGEALPMADPEELARRVGVSKGGGRRKGVFKERHAGSRNQQVGSSRVHAISPATSREISPRAANEAACMQSPLNIPASSH